jgi:outer membrane protein insertion porin family
VPDTKFDDDKKLIFLNIDVDEGKQFYVRRIEFQGNTTTRDKVIRREIALEEGQVYNSRLWEFSLLRLNQLGYFEQLKPDDPNTTDKKLDEKDGTVDLALKVKEKGKNSIGLNGGVSGLEGAFIGLSYTTNNFLGLGETLQIQASIGNLMRSVLFGFTEPYLWDRPLQAGFTVYTTRTSYNQARQYAVLTGQQLNLPSYYLQNLQNYTQSSTGFTSSLSYPLHRSLKRVGITYSFDNSSLIALSDASKALFTNLAFRGISGPNALTGIITSKILPSFTINTLDASYQPHSGKQLFLGGEVAGLGGTVKSVRPIVQYKQFFPMQKRRNAIGINFQGSFLTGYGGLVAPPFQRFYMGGENDLRGFDIRSVSPIAFLPNKAVVNLTNPDGSTVLKDPSNPRLGPYQVPIPIASIVQPGGDLSLFGNVEYRISIVGPVTLAPFMDMGIDPIVRSSQLRINPGQLSDINNTPFGCPVLDIALNCIGGEKLTFSGNLKPVAGSNWTPRMSTGLELQVMLPVINAPFRIYWAYNPLRLDSTATAPTAITRSMFPGATAPFLYRAAGDYTYTQTINTYGANFTLREPRKTFRFTVATTF